MILGWTRSDQREIMTLQEYIQEFDPRDISPKSVVFDLEKLKWLNGVYIRNLSYEQLKTRIEAFLPSDFPRDRLNAILPLVSERLVKLKDIEDLTEFFYRSITISTEELLKKSTTEEVHSQLLLVNQALGQLGEWNLESLETALRALQEQHEWKKSQFFMMIRVAVTGKTATPPLFETMTVLGRDTTLERLLTAQHQLE